MEKLSKQEMKAIRGGYNGIGWTCDWASYEQNTGTYFICTNYWPTAQDVVNGCTDDQDRPNFSGCPSGGSACTVLSPCP